MSAFCDWFDTAPLWCVGIITFLCAVALCGVVCAWVWWVNGRRF